MDIKIIENISEEIYNKIKILNNYSIYHSLEWHRFLEVTFHWKVKGIIAFKNSEIVFFVPFIQKHRLSKRKVNITLPFSHKVGVLYKDSIKNELENILDKIKQYINNLEIHDKITSNDFKICCLNYQTILNLKQFNTKEELFKSMDYKSVRYEINKALKSEIKIESIINNKTINDFYNCELETRHRQGAPIYPINFFHNLFKHIPESERSMFTAYKDDNILAGVIFFHYQNTTVYAYSASKQNSKNVSATDLLLWNGIKNAFEKGYEIFDFGTTPIHLEGLKKYKEKWSASSHELYYSYFPDAITIKRDGFGVKIISSVLKNMPINLFKTISPKILKLAI